MLKENQKISVNIKRTGETATLLVEKPSTTNNTFVKFIVSNNETINIGSNNTNDIVIDKDGVSNFHAKIIFNDGNFSVVNLDSHYGSFINDYSFKEKDVNSGDVLFIMGTSLIFGKNFIALNNTLHIKKINENKLKEFVPQEIDTTVMEKYFDEEEN